MKLKFLTLIVTALLAGFACAAPEPADIPTAAGMWAQIYPDGRVGGWFLIFENNNGLYEGAIAKMFLKPGENPNPICTHCTGDQKNQPSLGLIIIKGMRRDSLTYDNGTILDPRDGHVYQAKMTLSSDGQQLTVRGFVGFELFGQNQTWKRLPNDVLPLDQMPPNLVQYWQTLPKPSEMTNGTGGRPQRGGNWRAYQAPR